MPSTGFTAKTGRVAFAAFGILCLIWSSRYFNPFTAKPQFAKLPRPPEGDLSEYPKVEELTAAAEENHPFKSTESWFFGADGDDGVAVKAEEEWFRVSEAKSATSVDSSIPTKSNINEISVAASTNAAPETQSGSDAGSFEEYVAPANVSAQQTTAIAADAGTSSMPSNSKFTESVSGTITAAKSTLTALILYAYSPAAWALPNLKFFLKHGLHESAAFIFIINGALVPSDASSQISSAFVDSADERVLDVLDALEPYAENYPNVEIWKRPNTCYDLGAYAEVLKSNSSALVKSHERFILINASLRGPFVPFWSQECWSDAYLRLINTRVPGTSLDAGSVKLVGMTINCVDVRPRHIQSMILATDRVGMEILLGQGDESASKLGSNNASGMPYTNIGIDGCPNSMEAAVNIEVSLTSLIQSHNYTVRAMMAEYWSKQEYELDCANSDINAAKGAYEGGDLGVFETLFIKTRWAVESDQMERLTQWYDGAVDTGMSGGARDKCVRVL